MFIRLVYNLCCLGVGLHLFLAMFSELYISFVFCTVCVLCIAFVMMLLLRSVASMMPLLQSAHLAGQRSGINDLGPLPPPGRHFGAVLRTAL